MNLPQVNRIVEAVLYEGYILYPYRPSSKEEPPAVHVRASLSARLQCCPKWRGALCDEDGVFGD
jgi:hypothetical protein